MTPGGQILNRHVGISYLGDSQTAADYVAFPEKWPTIVSAALNLRFFNVGITSAKTGWALGRDHDQTPPSVYPPVIQWSWRKTVWAFVLFGINDSATSYHPELTPDGRVDLFRTQQTELVELLKKRRTTPILLTNPQYPSTYTGFAARNALTWQYDNVKREISDADPDVYLIDTWNGFVQSNNNGVINWFQAANDLHFNALGNSIQANWIIAHWPF